MSIDLHKGICFYMISKYLIWCLVSKFLCPYGMNILKKVITLAWFWSIKVSASRSLADWKGSLSKVDILSLVSDIITICIVAIVRNRKSVPRLMIFNRWFWLDSSSPIDHVTLWVLIINFYLWRARKIEAIRTYPVMPLVPRIFVFTFRSL